jgi:hypothetical protein
MLCDLADADVPTFDHPSLVTASFPRESEHRQLDRGQRRQLLVGGSATKGGF